MLVGSLGLLSDSTCVLKAKPGELHVKRREPGILFISLPVGSLFKLVIILRRCRFTSQFNVMDDVIQKVQRHDDPIKAHALR